MRKGALRVAAVAATLLAIQADPSAAAGHPGHPVEVTVVNNHAATVQVYVEDAEGRMHRLGTVGSAHARRLTIPEEITALGALEVKVFTDEPVWSNAGERYGVRTRALDPQVWKGVQFWVEPNLAQSQVELVRA